MSKSNRPALFVLAALPFTAGLVLAASGNTPSAQTQTPQQSQAQPQTSGTNYAQVYLQKLAAALGVSTERLRAAALAAGNATVDQALGAGDLSAEGAARLKERLQQDPLRFGLGRGALGRGDHERGPGKHGAAHGPRHQHGEPGQGRGTPAPAPKPSGAGGTGT